jgi:hypothetical protein
MLATEPAASLRLDHKPIPRLDRGREVARARRFAVAGSFVFVRGVARLLEVRMAVKTAKQLDAAAAKLRVKIAADVIGQLEDKKSNLVPTIAAYVQFDLSAKDEQAVSLRTSLRDIRDKASACRVCAKGALLICGLTHIDLQAGVVGGVTNFGDLDDKINNDEQVKTILKEFGFAEEQSDLIEYAFMGENWGGDTWDIDSDERDIAKLYEQKFSDPSDRLIAIMENIVNNDGTFVCDETILRINEDPTPLKKSTGTAAKRVELAQDVIAQIQLRQGLLNIKQGTYVRATLKAEGKKLIDKAVKDAQEEDEYAHSAEIDLQAILKKAKKCDVCAKGAMFVCGVLRHNELTVDDVSSLSDINNEIGEGDFVTRYLVDEFGFKESDADTIEGIFEESETSYTSWGVSLNDVEEAVASLYVKRYKDPADRLVAMMANVSRNGGSFVLDWDQVDLA